MIIITGTTIEMTRGDTLRVRVSIEMDDEPYTPAEGDSVAFYLKHAKLNSSRTSYKDPAPVITKAVPIATMVLQLDPEDTKPLEFGEYAYDLEITFANGTVDTFINNATLTLLPEVG